MCKFVLWKDIRPKCEPYDHFTLLFDHAILFSIVLSACLQDPEDQHGECQAPTGRITQFQIKFEVGSTVFTTINVDISACLTGRCSNTFNLSNVQSGRIPSSYDRVSVVAKNIVGVGAEKTCTTQTISKLHEFVITIDTYTHINLK